MKNLTRPKSVCRGKFCAAHDVWFASGNGKAAVCDQITLTGVGLPKHLQTLSAKNPHKGFYVEDGHLLSARWPGDCYTLAHAFLKKL